MTLSDPRDALADQSSFIDYLVGLTGLARTVRTLASAGAPHPTPPGDADDLVHVLLGLAGLGDAIERLAETPLISPYSTDTPVAHTRWLR